MKRLLICTLMIFSLQSFAGLLVEPFLGYGFGEVTATGSDDALVNDANITSPVFGARVGYTLPLSLSLGLGLGLAPGSYEQKADSNSKGDYEMTDLSLFASFEFPVLVKAYAGYVFSATHTATADGPTNESEFSGNGIYVGAGFTGLPFIDINLEYRIISYDEVEALGTPTSLSNTDFSAFVLSISLPLQF